MRQKKTEAPPIVVPVTMSARESAIFESVGGAEPSDMLRDALDEGLLTAWAAVVRGSVDVIIVGAAMS